MSVLHAFGLAKTVWPPSWRPAKVVRKGFDWLRLQTGKELVATQLLRRRSSLCDEPASISRTTRFSLEVTERIKNISRKPSCSNKSRKRRIRQPIVVRGMPVSFSISEGDLVFRSSAVSCTPADLLARIAARSVARSTASWSLRAETKTGVTFALSDHVAQFDATFVLGFHHFVQGRNPSPVAFFRTVVTNQVRHRLLHNCCDRQFPGHGF